MKIYQLFENELPVDDASRMQRAKELGFTIAAYHGTGMKFDEFDPEKNVRPSHTSGHAPHFAGKKAEANGYAKKRKAEGAKTMHVLHVLLRIKNPWNLNHDHPISVEEYTKIVGHPPKNKWDLFGSCAMQDAKREIGKSFGLLDIRGGDKRPTDQSYEQFVDEQDKILEKIGGNKRIWNELYKRLIRLGYDALIDPQTPADHSAGYYAKYVILDPKNVRSINARFDPAKSESRNLMD